MGLDDQDEPDFSEEHLAFLNYLVDKCGLLGDCYKEIQEMRKKFDDVVRSSPEAQARKDISDYCGVDPKQTYLLATLIGYTYLKGIQRLMDEDEFNPESCLEILAGSTEFGILLGSLYARKRQIEIKEEIDLDNITTEHND